MPNRGTCVKPNQVKGGYAPGPCSTDPHANAPRSAGARTATQCAARPRTLRPLWALPGMVPRGDEAHSGGAPYPCTAPPPPRAMDGNRPNTGGPARPGHSLAVLPPAPTPTQPPPPPPPTATPGRRLPGQSPSFRKCHCFPLQTRGPAAEGGEGSSHGRRPLQYVPVHSHKKREARPPWGPPGMHWKGGASLCPAAVPLTAKCRAKWHL